MEKCEFKRIKLEKPQTNGGIPLFEAFAKKQKDSLIKTNFYH